MDANLIRRFASHRIGSALPLAGEAFSLCYQSVFNFWGTVRMPFEIKGDELLSAKIAVRLTPIEKDKLRQDADLAAFSVSELVRRRYFGRPIIAEADMLVIRELTRIAAQQRQLGALIKKINRESREVYSDQVSDTIAEMAKVVRLLASAIEKVAG
jgi:hypothetical protein